MKLARSFTLAGGLALLASTQAAITQLERAFIHGVEYVRLDDWARAQGLWLKWVTPKREVKILGNQAALFCEADSRRIVLNGVSVWVGWPVALQRGSLFMAKVDLETAVRPVLFPGRKPGRKLRTVVLDPGHGGADPGNREGTQNEKTYTLLLAKELSAQLSKAGFKVFLTRSADREVDLDARITYARQRGADLFLSLHFNSADGAGASAVRGAEVYCMTPARTSSTNARGAGAASGSYSGNRNDAQNMLLAYQVQKALVTKLGMEDRGVRRARFAVLRSATMPAVLIESAFMSHGAEAKRIYNATWRRQLAQTIVSGVQAYKKSVEG